MVSSNAMARSQTGAKDVYVWEEEQKEETYSAKSHNLTR